MDVIIRYSNYVSTIKRKEMKHSITTQINAIEASLPVQDSLRYEPMMEAIQTLTGYEKNEQAAERAIAQNKELKEAGSKLLEAMNQYSFSLSGYGQGSASISEVNHANEEVFKAQNVLFELLKK